MSKLNVDVISIETFLELFGILIRQSAVINLISMWVCVSYAKEQSWMAA